MRVALFAFFTLFSTSLFSQSSDIGVNFSAQKEAVSSFLLPIESYNGFAGTYGELRGNHFHCGLDMRTAGTTGRKIFAADEGYVSRITVSAWGFGNMIEVTHPSGYRTIYGHLLRFAPKYQKLVRDKQYREKSWNQAIDFPKDSLLVKRGDLIAYSGNSGSSGGPHLHFEVLDEEGTPVNLQLTDIYNLSDKTSPLIRDVRFVGCATLYGALYTFPVPAAKDSVTAVPRSFYVAVDAYDLMEGTNGKLAVYKYEVLIDSTSVFSFTEGNIPYSTGRYIASLLDTPLRRSTSRYYVKTQVDPANKLSDRITAVNDGIITLQDTASHTITVKVSDVYGNLTSADYTVKRVDSLFTSAVPFAPKGEFMKWNAENVYSFDGLKVKIPEGALYRDGYIEIVKESELYKSSADIPAMSALWKIGDENVPLHKSMEIEMQASVPVGIKDKVLLARVGRNGSLSGVGGSYNALTGVLTAKVGGFGKYCVTADILPPEVTVRVKEGALVKGSSIKITIKDKLSGVNSFNCEIDGHWVVAEHDGKTSTLEIPLYDAGLSKGRVHHLTVTVTDNVGNKQVVKRSFKW